MMQYRADNAIHLPYSKSIGARYLTASFFAGALRNVEKLTDCDDLEVIQKALQDLSSGERDEIDVHASGTAFRIMAAVISSTPGAVVVLTGTPRLCSRPMTPLLEVLHKAGAYIESLGKNETGPYRISGKNLKGGEYEIRGDVSSQFITALMLVAPTWEGGMTLRFTSNLVSRPYIYMTAQLMHKFGVEVELTDEYVKVPEAAYVAPVDFDIEADWSAAGFIYGASTLTTSPIFIDHLASPHKSLQGDSATAAIFKKLGVESDFNKEYASIRRCREIPERIEVDLSDNPDLVPALAVACIVNEVRFRFTGVRNLRLKESDRLAALQNEFEKLGYVVETGDDHIEWKGKKVSPAGRVVVETYDDHRIAMAFAIAAMKWSPMTISNPDVVEKSFSDFWNQLPRLGLRCRREGDVMVVENDKKDSGK